MRIQDRKNLIRDDNETLIDPQFENIQVGQGLTKNGALVDVSQDKGLLPRVPTFNEPSDDRLEPQGSGEFTTMPNLGENSKVYEDPFLHK